MAKHAGAAVSAEERKLRILCLHGYLQTGAVFRMKTGSLRKAFKSKAEFIFMDAPFPADAHLSSTEDKRLLGGTEGGKAWWSWKDVAATSRPSLSAEYSGWEEAYDSLVAALKEHQPINGILGFSQGATATALLLSGLAKAGPSSLGFPPPRFAIIVSGFLPRDPSYAQLIQEARPAVPTLFVYGTDDKLVSVERTKQLIDAFEPAAVAEWEHGGAHLVPTCSGDFKQALAAFLDPFRGSGHLGGAAAPAVCSLSEPAQAERSCSNKVDEAVRVAAVVAVCTSCSGRVGVTVSA